MSIPNVHLAVLRNQCQTVVNLLREGANVNEQDKRGRTPLHLAVSSKCRRCVENIMKYNPLVNLQDSHGDTALHVALVKKNFPALKLITQCSTFDFEAEKNGLNVLQWAATLGNSFAVNCVLKAKPSLVDSQDGKGNSALHIAATHNHKVVAEVLIYSGKANIDLFNNTRKTPLMMAAEHGSFDVLEVILKCNPVLNHIDVEGNTALYLALCHNKGSVVELLVKHPCVDLNLKNSLGLNIIHEAAIRGNAGAIKHMLSANPKLADVEDLGGFRLLHLAAMNGTLGIAQMAIDIGKANIDLVTKENQTPLIIAIDYGHSDVAEFLLKQNPNVNVQDKYKNTALSLAIKKSLNNIVDLIVTSPNVDLNFIHQSGCSIFHIATKTGNKHAIKCLIEADAPMINLCNLEGLSALHIATMNGNKDIAELLMSLGKVDVNVETSSMKTSLIIAVEEHHSDLVESILKFNPDVNFQTENGNSALHFAILKGCEKSIELLTKYPSIDLSSENDLGLNVLHEAAKLGNVFAIRCVLAACPPLVDSQSPCGFSALHYAVRNGLKDAVEVLMDSGQADVNLVCGNGRTPLMIAACYCQNEVVESILKFNPDVNKQDYTKNTALHLAVQNHQNETINLISNHPSVDLGIQNSKGLNPFHFATLVGNLLAVKCMFSVNPQLVDVLTTKWKTALHLAAMYGHREIAEFLIDIGKANVDVTDNTNKSPLMLAVIDNHVGLIKTILQNHPNLGIQDCYGDTALHIAIVESRHTVAKLILKKCSAKVLELRNRRGFNVLHTAALENKRLSARNILTKNGQLVDSKTNSGATALHIAVFNGHKNVVQVLTSFGKANLNSLNSEHETPLMSALVGNHISLVKFLLKHKSDVNIQNREDDTILHIGVRQKSLNAVRLILETPHVNMELRNKKGFCAIHEAAIAGYTAIAKCMLLIKPSLAKITDDDGYSILHLAALNGHQNFVCMLKEFCDPTIIDSTNKSDNTPLMLALKENHVETVKALLEFCPNLNIQGPHGDTALHIAIENCPWAIKPIVNCSTVDLTINNQVGFTPLHLAAQIGDVSTVECILAKEPSLVDVTESDGFTALHFAAYNGNKETVEFLIYSGQAKINLLTHSGLTPLLLALSEDHNDVVEVLVKNSADVTIEDEEGNTAFYIALVHNNPEVAELILKSPTMNFTLNNEFGLNALHVAVAEGHVFLVEYILRKDPSMVNLADNDGNTALHLAAESGFVEGIEVLVNLGKANVNLTNSEQQTPLILASIEGQSSAVGALLLTNIDVNVQDKEGNTALHIAMTKCSNAARMIAEHPTVSFLIRNNMDCNALHWAALNRNTSTVQLIVEAKPSLIDVQRPDGFTALHLAASIGDKATTNILINPGKASLDIVNNSNQTALILAVINGIHCGVIETLIENKASVSKADGAGNTALHHLLCPNITTPSAIDLSESPEIREIYNDLKTDHSALCTFAASAEGNSQNLMPEVLAVAAYFVRHGANLTSKNHKGESSTSVLSPEKTELLKLFASEERRASKRSHTGDEDECLICLESSKNVTLEPCGHRNVCSSCSSSLKKCLTCRQIISKRISSNGDMIMYKENNTESPQHYEAKADYLEKINNCIICLERPFNVVFLCGHSACDSCAPLLKSCSVCRAPITSRIKIYR